MPSPGPLWPGPETPPSGGTPSRRRSCSGRTSGRLYVVEEEGTVHGAFAFLLGEDPTYQVIEGGAWKSAAPYGTLHRVAGSGEVRGLFGQMVDYAWGVIPHLRIDTHENNAVMRHLVEKHGFQRCGVIYLEDGAPRIAFERI